MDNETRTPDTQSETPDETKAPKEKRTLRDYLGDIYELLEMLGVVSATIMIIFAFVFRLNIVDGHSMDVTLAHGEYLGVSDLFYEPTPGDIVIVHKINADPYVNPIVKRVIATEGQTVDIDFSTWTLRVDGEIIDEPYRYISDDMLLTSDWTFPVTVGENEIFVMGDNRNNSADSRTEEIGMIDTRCVIGKAYVRIFPMNKFEVFENPRKS